MRKKIIVSLKEGVFSLATIAGAAVEVNWRPVPYKHDMVFLRWLQQERRSIKIIKTLSSRESLEY